MWVGRGLEVTHQSACSWSYRFPYSNHSCLKYDQVGSYGRIRPETIFTKVHLHLPGENFASCQRKVIALLSSLRVCALHWMFTQAGENISWGRIEPWGILRAPLHCAIIISMWSVHSCSSNISLLYSTYCSQPFYWAAVIIISNF